MTFERRLLASHYGERGLVSDAGYRRSIHLSEPFFKAGLANRILRWLAQLNTGSHALPGRAASVTVWCAAKVRLMLLKWIGRFRSIPLPPLPFPVALEPFVGYAAGRKTRHLFADVAQR